MVNPVKFSFISRGRPIWKSARVGLSDQISEMH